MGRTIEEQIETPADRLRRQISRAESLVVSLKGTGGGAVELLELLDALQPQLAALGAAGMDLRSEEARLQAVYSALQLKKVVLLRELKAAHGIESLRAARQPAAEQWWWFLDQALRDERRRAARRYGLIALVVIVVASALGLIASRLLKPDPTIVAMYDNANTALQLVTQGDYQGAIPHLEKNLTLAPQEAEWPIRIGALQVLLGQGAAADAAFEQGRALSASEFDFLIQRGQSYNEAGAYDRAQVDLQRAATMNPQSALAQYLLGAAYGGLGQRAEAIAAYERASDLAGEGQEQIHIMARLEAARMLQAIELPTAASPIP